jgi:hypothetical protein
MIRTTARTKSLLALALLGLVLSASLSAQTILADPNDAIYADLDSWATKGLLKNLPRLRPYTFAMTVGLLKEVAAAGDATDAAEAARYLGILKDGAFHVRTDARALASVSASGTRHTLAAAPGFSINSLIGDRLGISVRGDLWLAQGVNPSTLMPYGHGYDRDPLYGSGSALGHSLEVTQDLASDLSYGNESLGVQAGFMRGSWGPVYDNGVVFGPQSPQSGQLTFSWRTPTLTSDFGFMMLQQGWPTSTGLKDALSESIGLNSQKYLVIHGINWSPTQWLELGLFESMVWVDRVEPLYLIPLSEFFLSQSVSGYADNAFAGVSTSLYLPHSMKLDMVGYADDFNFAGLLEGNFDTKWKMAVQACLSWAPESPLVQRLSLDYTAIGPYTYTHWTTTGTDTAGNPYIGALAYTNGGQNIGPALDPNSDRIAFRARSRNLEGFQVSGLLSFIRHGNASAGVMDGTTPYAGNSASGDDSGSIADPGVFDAAHGGGWIFQGSADTGTSPRYFRFLSQAVLQMSAQAGFTVDYARRIDNLGTIDAGLGYTLEYIANPGFVAGATSLKHYVSLKVGLAL